MERRNRLKVRFYLERFVALLWKLYLDCRVRKNILHLGRILLFNFVRMAYPFLESKANKFYLLLKSFGRHLYPKAVLSATSVILKQKFII